jgi:phospholipid/cholesterol/gamma-HCH transport system ATP-binding protein
MHIKVENLHKSFGSLHVLRGINLEIMPGDLAVIVGGSGSGKSVLLKHLVGLLKPDSGRILIDGDDIVPKSEREMMDLRRRFGMIFQGGGMLQSLTVGENVGLALAELDHKSKRNVNDIVRKKLVQVGLDGREDQMPSTLSGGQRKRAAIARALTTDADCFLFDEPTAGLDPIMSANIDIVISDVNRETKATTIVVTHDLISVLTISQKIYMLHDGVMIAAGTVEEFRNSKDKRVQDFLARDLERDNPKRVTSTFLRSAESVQQEQDKAGKTAVATADDEDTSPDAFPKN